MPGTCDGMPNCHTVPSERNPKLSRPPSTDPTPTCGVALKAVLDVVITANVVLNVLTWSVAVVEVLRFTDEICRTQTVWLAAIVPGTFVKLAVQPIEYSPPVTLIGTVVLIPVMATVFETI